MAYCYWYHIVKCVFRLIKIVYVLIEEHFDKATFYNFNISCRIIYHYWQSQLDKITNWRNCKIYFDSLTDKNFANIHFNETEYLTHGRRYSVCIYAPETVIKHEKWTETLDTVTSCSDGVTVDLTPPVPGKVWIGPDPIVFYQVTLLKFV